MAIDVIEKARVNLMLHHCFFGNIILGLTVVEDPTVWMAATDGTSLFINRENLGALPMAEIVGVFKHEAMHIALMHPFRVGARNFKKYNRAADMVINPIVLGEGGALPKNVLDGSKYLGKSTEQIYALLPDEAGDNQKGGKSGGESGGNPLDDDIREAPDKSSVAEAQVMAKVAQAAQIAKAVGQMPGGVRALLDDILNPTVAWVEELRDFLVEASATDYTFARPNRRFVAQGIYLPSISGNDAMGKLGVVIDTSGSMGEQQLRQNFGEICGAVEDCAPSELVIVYCDSGVNHVDYFDHATADDVRITAKRVGGGGTDMTKALDWFEDNAPDVKAIIVLTDGFTPFGEERSTPVLWAIDGSTVSPVGRTVKVGAR